MVLRVPMSRWLRHRVVAAGGNAVVSVDCDGTHGGDDAHCGECPDDEEFDVHVYISSRITI